MATQEIFSTTPNKGLLDAAMSGTQQVQAQTTADKVAQTAAPGREQASQSQTSEWAPDSKSTVQGQLSNVLANDSPLLTQARTRASQSAASRGLLNSSMAVSAGESAAYDVALPIAQQDASTHAQAGQFNANAKNQSSMFNAGESNKLQGQQLDQEFQSGLANADAKNTALARDQSVNLDAQRSNQQATTGLVSQQMQQSTAREQQVRDIKARAAEQQRSLTAQEQAQVRDIEAQERAQSLDQAFKTALAQADNETKVELQRMDAETRTGLAQIEADYKVLMQSSQSAHELYQQSLKNMTDIMMNKDLSSAGKQSALNNQYSLLKDGMGVLGSISNLNLKDLLNPGNISGIGGKPVDAPAPPPAPKPPPTTTPPEYGA